MKIRMMKCRDDLEKGNVEEIIENEVIHENELIRRRSEHR